MKKIILFMTACIIATAGNSQALALQWAEVFSGTASGSSKASAIDAAGNVITAGVFAGSTDFDHSTGTHTLHPAGQSDVFVAKADAAGNYIWAKQLGVALSGSVSSITLDSAGNSYLTGWLSDSINAAFICKLDAAGTLSWIKTIKGAFGRSLIADPSGNICITGYFSGTPDFNPGPGTVTLTSQGNQDIFVLKLDAAGNFIWAKTLGGTQADSGVAVVTDGTGNICVMGYFGNTVDFNPGAGVFDLTAAGNPDAFILKLDNAGNFTWAKNTGYASGSCYPTCLSLGASGNIYAAGTYTGTVDFDPGPGTSTLTTLTNRPDMFVLKLDASGALSWVKSFAGTFDVIPFAIALDASENIYTTGYFSGSCDFDPGTATYSLVSGNNSIDIFISKLTATGNFVWAENIGTSNSQSFSRALTMTLDGSGSFYIGGSVEGSGINIDPGPGTYTLASHPNTENIFIAKYNTLITGIKENVLSGDNTLIYPNPFTGSFKLQTALNDLHVEIYNDLGGLVYLQEGVNSGGDIDLSHEPAGLYFLKITDAGGHVATHKILKE